MARQKITLEAEIYSWIKNFSEENPQYGGAGEVVDMLVNFFIHKGGPATVRKCQEPEPC